jgi:serine/threonine protein kinase
LDDHLHGGKESPVISWEVRYKIAVGIARALDYLHDGCPKPVVHRDVKASNILLTATFDAQLSDFGLAKWAPTDVHFLRCNDVVGTFGYLAPEYFMYGRVNEGTDVYSFGVVLLELLTGRQPIDTTKPKGQENLVLWARPLLEEKNIDILADTRLESKYDLNEFKSMMLSAALCIRHSAHRRPPMSKILKILSGEGESLGYWPRQELTNKSIDMEDTSSHVVDGAPHYGDTDIQAHLALAMLGIDDGVDDESSVQDQSGDLVPHSSAYLEEYLKGRCSRSASFNS